MRILFDQGTPVPLWKHLSGHTVSTAFEMGWPQLANGDLLAAAEGQFGGLVTTDQSLRCQQILAGRRLAILVLPFASWPKPRTCVTTIVTAVGAPARRLRGVALELTRLTPDGCPPPIQI